MNFLAILLHLELVYCENAVEQIAISAYRFLQNQGFWHFENCSFWHQFSLCEIKHQPQLCRLTQNASYVFLYCAVVLTPCGFWLNEKQHDTNIVFRPKFVVLQIGTFNYKVFFGKFLWHVCLFKSQFIVWFIVCTLRIKTSNFGGNANVSVKHIQLYISFTNDMSRFYDSQLHSFQNIENIQKEQIRTTSILPVSNSTLPVEVVKFCLSQANYMYEDYRKHKDALIAWIKHLPVFFIIAQIIFSGPLGSVSLVLVVLNIQYCLRICLRALLLLLFVRV